MSQQKSENVGFQSENLQEKINVVDLHCFHKFKVFRLVKIVVGMLFQRFGAVIIRVGFHFQEKRLP